MTDVMFTFVHLGAKIVVGAYIPTRQNLAMFRALFVLPAVIAGLSYFVESSYSVVIRSAAFVTTTQDGWSCLKQGLWKSYMALGLY